LLSGLLRNRRGCLAAAQRRVKGKRAVVLGNAPSLERDLEGLEKRGILKDCRHSGGEGGESAVILAADGATAALLRRGAVPDIVVTDLDGPADALIEADRLGSIMVVHAHGDNLDALGVMVPRLKRVIGTCQCRPPTGLYNFGGFTDGDRCVFFALESGAAAIELAGFDFEDESVTTRKKKKLAWARKLIDMALSEKNSK